MVHQMRLKATENQRCNTGIFFTVTKLIQYCPIMTKYFAVPGPLVSPAVVVCGWCKLISDLDPTPVRVILIGLQVCKWGQIYIFSLSDNLISDDLWPWFMTFDCIIIWRFPYYINKPRLVPIGLQFFKWGHFHIFSLFHDLISVDLWPWYMTFDCMVHILYQ